MLLLLLLPNVCRPGVDESMVELDKPVSPCALPCRFEHVAATCNRYHNFMALFKCLIDSSFRKQFENGRKNGPKNGNSVALLMVARSMIGRAWESVFFSMIIPSSCAKESASWGELICGRTFNGHLHFTYHVHVRLCRSSSTEASALVLPLIKSCIIGRFIDPAKANNQFEVVSEKQHIIRNPSFAYSTSSKCHL